MSLGMVSPILLTGAAIAFLLGLKTYSTQWKLVISAIVFFFCIAPVNDLPIAYYIRGVVGDLSITTQLILATYWYMAFTGKTTDQKKNNNLTFAGFIVFTSLWFYPCTLGLTYFDPYDLGYNINTLHWCLLTYFFSAALYFYYRNNIFLCGTITLSTLAFYFNLLESDNYWDYLIDPILVLGSIVFCFFSGLSAAKHSITRSARKKA